MGRGGSHGSKNGSEVRLRREALLNNANTIPGPTRMSQSQQWQPSENKVPGPSGAVDLTETDEIQDKKPHPLSNNEDQKLEGGRERKSGFGRYLFGVQIADSV